MPRTCSICATANPDDARFCRGCGAALKGTTVAPSALPVTTVPCPVCRHLNGSGTRFCAKCGCDQLAAPAATTLPPSATTTLPPPATTTRPPPAAATLPPPAAVVPRSKIWLASGAVAVTLLLAAAAWWLLAPSYGSAGRSNTPAPESAASVAAAAVLVAQPTPPGPASAAVGPALTPAELWDPIPADELQAARDQAARLRVAREAKALAAREQAALADRDAARQRTDDAGARTPASAAPVAGPAPRSAAPPAAVTPAIAGTVQEACANRNPIAQAICESRECGRTEHANEATCKRVRAAEERRRQPE